MKTTLKKTTCSVLAISVLSAMTGCSFLDKSKQEVQKVAEDFCDAIVDRDIDTVLEMAEDELDEEDFEELKEFLNSDENGVYSDEITELVTALFDTMEYEIDEDSIKADGKKGKGSVEVTFSFVDLEELFECECEDLDDLIDAISDVDTVDVDMKLEFVKDDDEWLVEDVEDILEETYSEFTMYSLVFALVDPYYESNYGFEGYSGNGDLDFFGMGYDGVYDVEDDCEIGYASSDSVWISVYLMYDMSEGDVDLSGYYSEVVKDGDIVAYEFDSLRAAVYSEDGVIEPGTYEFTFYDPDGVVINEALIIVEG